MAKADAVEVDFSGGERSATRFAELDHHREHGAVRPQPERHGLRGHALGSATDAGLRRRRRSRRWSTRRRSAARARRARTPTCCRSSRVRRSTSPSTPRSRAASTSARPSARAWSSRASTSAEKKGVLGSGYIPKTYQTTCTANSKGLFAYYQYAEAGFILTCRTPDGGGSGWAGITGVKDVSLIDAARADRDRRRQGAQEPEAAGDRAGRYTDHPRAAASARASCR